MKKIKYTEILRLNNELGQKDTSKKYKIGILANVSVHQCSDICEYILRMHDINAEVILGDYDNIVQDSVNLQSCDLIIIFWELGNLIDGFHFKAELYDENQLAGIIEKTKSEIDLVFKNIANTSMVIMNKFTCSLFSEPSISKNKLGFISANLNQHLETNVKNNIKLVDITNVFSQIGITNCFNPRNFYQAKSPYTIDFYLAYMEYILPIILSSTGKRKKLLVLDCDNTLWKGVIGEDGFEGIQMSMENKVGSIFSEIQHRALALSKAGILIALCSKNNKEDVNNVINNHPDMILKNENIVTVRVNWDDKASNIRDIASELNIGTDSIVFIDDSEFEINLVKESLPDVTTKLVPSDLNAYPKVMQEVRLLFYSNEILEDDKNKLQQYKSQEKRNAEKLKHKSIDDYLASLGLEIKICRDDPSLSPRLSQLTQKTNQFNLTTKRYTERDIENFIISDHYIVYSLSVSDKFGDSGVTGLCIIQINKEKSSATIDTLLMSCRIIGRNIEYKLMEYILTSLSKENIKHVNAEYIKTLKNKQTAEFYEKCYFSLIEDNSDYKKYQKELNITLNKQFTNINYIEVIHEESIS